MKVTNSKNIVILALVLINIFFLAVVFWGVYSDRSNKAESLRDLGALLQKSGITLAVNNVHEGSSLQEYTFSRSQDAEKALAEALLGPVTKTDKGGNIIDYSGDMSMAEFRNGGYFRFTFRLLEYPAGPGALSAAQNMLKTMKIVAASVTSAGDKGNETVIAVCALNGQPIYNCQIEFEFINGSLGSIRETSKYVTGITVTPEKADMSSPATALMKFLSDVKSGDYRCSKITAVDPGYYIPPSSVPGEGKLKACWRLETDNGIFYIDAVTWDVEPA